MALIFDFIKDLEDYYLEIVYLLNIEYSFFNLECM